MADHFGLAVYDGNSERTMPVSDYLALAEAGDPPFGTYLGLVSLDLTVDGHRYWPARASVGDLARWAVQLDAAADRIEGGLPALVRSAVDDGAVGGYFLFEPNGETIRISMAAIADPDFSHRYPVERSGAPAGDVYEYVLTHRDEVLRSIDDEWSDVFFTDVLFPSDALVVSFRREAAAGRRLYEVLDVPFYVEL
jgi:hypothetical protein